MQGAGIAPWRTHGILPVVQPKTEELLHFLLWTAERRVQPVFRRLDGHSFEGWAYQSGLQRQAMLLVQQGFLERGPGPSCLRDFRLTEAGRQHALGGRDPEARWSRVWDGQWRMVLFDLPASQNTRRTRLHRRFRAQGFGCLQNSVWVTPDPLDQERQHLERDPINVESLVFLEARPCAGESDAQIVAGAWDLPRINHAYDHYLDILHRRPLVALNHESAAITMLDLKHTIIFSKNHFAKCSKAWPDKNGLLHRRNCFE